MRRYRTVTEGVLPGRPRVTLALVVFAVCLGLTLGVAHEAKADYQFGPYASTGSWNIGPDSNRYVPELYSGPNVGSCHNGIIGYDHPYYDYNASYGPLVHYITYDSCEMRRLGATSAGWSRLKVHERAHSRGWDHGEPPPHLNASYYATVYVR